MDELRYYCERCGAEVFDIDFVGVLRAYCLECNRWVKVRKEKGEKKNG